MQKQYTKCQDFVETQMPGFAQDDQKGLKILWMIVHDQTYHYQGFIRKITKFSPRLAKPPLLKILARIMNTRTRMFFEFSHWYEIRLFRLTLIIAATYHLDCRVCIKFGVMSTIFLLKSVHFKKPVTGAWLLKMNGLYILN